MKGGGKMRIKTEYMRWICLGVLLVASLSCVAPDVRKTSAPEVKRAGPFAEVPPEKECEEIDVRAEEFLKKAKTSRLTIYAVYVMDEPPRHDPEAAKMFARKLEAAGFQRVSVLDDPAGMPFEPEPNELNIFWKRARAFASQIQARPLDTDYVLMVDVFADFEEGAVGPVHAATTNAEGQFAYLALRNSHHPVYQAVRPKSMDDMLRLVIEDMKRKMEGDASQSTQRVWQ
jgi:hypothetical protein